MNLAAIPETDEEALEFIAEWDCDKAKNRLETIYRLCRADGLDISAAWNRTIDIVLEKSCTAGIYK